jgi:hypothetical protein
MQNYTEINLGKLLILKGKDVVFDVDRVSMCPLVSMPIKAVAGEHEGCQIHIRLWVA